MTDRLYSKEQIEEWAAKRADDAGRLARQLLDTMRENDRLLRLAKHSHDCKAQIVGKCICGLTDIQNNSIKRLTP